MFPIMMSKQQFYLLGAAVVAAGIVTMSGIFSSSSETAEWVKEAKLFPKDGTHSMKVSVQQLLWMGAIG